MARLPERTNSTRKAAFYIFRCCCLNLFCTRMFNSDGCYFEECLLETTGGPSAGLFCRGNFELSGDSGGRQAGGDSLFWFPPGTQRHSRHSAFSQSSSMLFSTLLWSSCQPALAAHLRGFAMPGALRRSVNRHLLCPASPDGQADFMGGR